MGVNVVPGQMNQPPKDIQGPSDGNTAQWVTTTSPQIDYYLRDHGPNPLDDTCPMQNVVETNDSKPGSLRTQNEINGGGDMFNADRDTPEESP